MRRVVSVITGDNPTENVDINVVPVD